MTSKPEAQFSVPLADLEDDERQLECAIPSAWLAQALEGTEARARGADGLLDVTLSKQGREVMVRGHLKAPIEMDCARSLEPFELDIETDVFLLLAPASGSTAAKPRNGKSAKKAPPQTSGASPRDARKTKKQRTEDDEDELLSEEDAARDVYSGEEIVLDSFIREFILLELPLFPLRSEDAPPIASPSSEPQTADRPIDPRLAPLAALRDRLRDKE
ncbi:MAG: DUF177 domain-containing protein [Polyangiaceae bacterium]